MIWKAVEATAVQNAGALPDDWRTAPSVLECASPLALWAQLGENGRRWEMWSAGDRAQAPGALLSRCDDMRLTEPRSRFEALTDVWIAQIRQLSLTIRGKPVTTGCWDGMNPNERQGKA